MGDINKVLGAAGPGLTIGDKTLTRPTKRMQAAFEDWLEARARKQVAAFAGVVSDDGLAGMAERFAERAEAGEYSFGGERCMKALATLPGCLEMIRLMLLPKHPDATADDAERLMTEYATELKIVLRQAAGKPSVEEGEKKKADA